MAIAPWILLSCLSWYLTANALPGWENHYLEFWLEDKISLGALYFYHFESPAFLELGLQHLHPAQPLVSLLWKLLSPPIVTAGAILTIATLALQEKRDSGTIKPYLPAALLSLPLLHIENGILLQAWLTALLLQRPICRKPLVAAVVSLLAIPGIFLLFAKRRWPAAACSLALWIALSLWEFGLGAHAWELIAAAAGKWFASANPGRSTYLTVALQWGMITAWFALLTTAFRLEKGPTPRNRWLTAGSFGICLVLFIAIGLSSKQRPLLENTELDGFEWVLAAHTLERFPRTADQVARLHVVNARIIPAAVDKLAKFATKSVPGKEFIYSRELAFLEHERKYAKALKEKLDQSDQIGIFFDHGILPREEQEPFSRARLWLDEWGETKRTVVLTQ